MARKRKQRRQQHGSAWHWKQTDCWYYTEPGTRKRVALFDEDGERIRGKENKEAARLALARIKLVDELSPPVAAANQKWTVARVFEVYLADLHKTANPEWTKQVQNWLNDLCSYCGALTVDEFKKKHLRDWIHKKTTWNHNTQRNVIASVKAAFNFCCKFDDLEANPVAGYEKPAGARQTLDQMRDVIWLLAPRASNWSELSHRLQSISSRILDGVKHEIVVEGEPPEGKPAIEWSRNVVTFLKEVLTNARRHSEAENIRVSFDWGETLVMDVEDNGRGFDTAASRDTSGTGLENLEQRAALLRASLDFRSEPGEGTTVRLSVPFSKG